MDNDVDVKSDSFKQSLMDKLTQVSLGATESDYTFSFPPLNYRQV